MIRENTLPKTMSSWVLSMFMDRDFIASLGKLLRCSTTLMFKIFLALKITAACLLSWHWAPSTVAWLPLFYSLSTFPAERSQLSNSLCLSSRSSLLWAGVTTASSNPVLSWEPGTEPNTRDASHRESWLLTCWHHSSWCSSFQGLIFARDQLF